MADYRRMVSYMYQYDKGIKKKNVGYARIEVRSGECKFTLHMQLLGLLDSIFPTYLIQRQGTEMELIYLGDSVCKNQVVDSKLTASDKNIMNSGHSLSDMGGMLLFLNDEVFYATEWDDKPVVLNEVLEALRPKEKKELVQDTQRSEEQQGTEEVLELSQTNPLKIEEMPLIDLVKNDESLEVWASNKEPKIEAKPEEAPAKSSIAIDPALDFSGIMSDKDIPVYKLPRGWKTIELLKAKDANQAADAKLVMDGTQVADAKHEQISDAKQEQIKEVQQVANIKQEADVKQVTNADQVVEVSRTVNAMPSQQYQPRFMKPQINTPSKQQSDHSPKKPDNWMVENQEPEKIEKPNQDSLLSVAGGTAGLNQTRRSETNYNREEEEKPLAAKIFESYPRIYPFEDNEVTMCVKIEPKDIGFLPVDAWVLSNNSFLMHGYYCYNHLIFAKMQDRYGSRYVLGVPGIYHSREQFMARMFGFECFKSIRKRELRQGDFGYWYIQISI